MHDGCHAWTICLDTTEEWPDVEDDRYHFQSAVDRSNGSTDNDALIEELTALMTNTVHVGRVVGSIVLKVTM